MAERIADYCEAVINVAEMCKPGLKCCVSRASFSNGDTPANFIIVDRNTTTSRPHTTESTTTSTSTYFIPMASTQSTTAAGTSMTTTASTTSASTMSAVTRSPSNAKPCNGECVNGLLALFCDDVDTNAFCPGEDSCCITNSVSSSSPATPPPSYYNHYTSPRTTPSTRYTSNYGNPSTTTAASMYGTKSTPQLPRCPGYCLLYIMAAFCERPAVLISQTSNCKKGSVCCDNTKVGSSHKPRPQTTAATTSTTTTPAAPPDPRPECPGSCIMPYLSFTCFSESTLFLWC